MVDVKARGVPFCAWPGARAPLSPRESPPPLGAQPGVTTAGPWANHNSCLGSSFISNLWLGLLLGSFQNVKPSLNLQQWPKGKEKRQHSGPLEHLSSVLQPRIQVFCSHGFNQPSPTVVGGTQGCRGLKVPRHSIEGA